MRPFGARLVAVLGWALLAAGACVLLYLVYALVFTGVEAERAQSALRTQWTQRMVEPLEPADDGSTSASAAVPSEPREIASAAPEDPASDGSGLAPDADITPPDRGVALLEFSRPGGSDTLVHDEPLVVLDDVALADLQDGPGHYPDTALPGEPGNFAVAGHRTTYGAPFYHLDVLRRGDRVLVTDRQGRRHTYAVAEQRVVLPGDTWVIGDDPLGSGEPTLTLTTCNPRFSAAERLVVHAELVS
ncbi:class E sortase [soil metagenome]